MYAFSGVSHWAVLFQVALRSTGKCQVELGPRQKRSPTRTVVPKSTSCCPHTAEGNPDMPLEYCCILF